MRQEADSDELKRQLPLELAQRLENKSPQFGKTVFMKMAYLLQELYGVPLGYRFSLYSYGPYSPEVLGDLEYAKSRQQVNVEYLGDTQGGFKITPADKASSTRNQNESIRLYDGKLNELVERFGSFNAKDLELRTTSIFLWKRLQPSREEDVNTLAETVQQLKPHFNAKTIRFVIDSLLKDGVVKFSCKK